MLEDLRVWMSVEALTKRNVKIKWKCCKSRVGLWMAKWSETNVKRRYRKEALVSKSGLARVMLRFSFGLPPICLLCYIQMQTSSQQHTLARLQFWLKLFILAKLFFSRLEVLTVSCIKKRIFIHLTYWTTFCFAVFEYYYRLIAMYWQWTCTLKSKIELFKINTLKCYETMRHGRVWEGTVQWVSCHFIKLMNLSRGLSVKDTIVQ